MKQDLIVWVLLYYRLTDNLPVNFWFSGYTRPRQKGLQKDGMPSTPARVGWTSGLSYLVHPGSVPCRTLGPLSSCRVHIPASLHHCCNDWRMIHCKRHLCYVTDDTDVPPYYKLHVVFMPSHSARSDKPITKPSIKLKEHIKREHFQPKMSVASIINLNMISCPLHVFQEVQCVDQIQC